MVRSCGEKERRRCSDKYMEVSGHWKIGRSRQRSNYFKRKRHKTGESREWKLDAPTPNRGNTEEVCSASSHGKAWTTILSWKVMEIGQKKSWKLNRFWKSHGIPLLHITHGSRTRSSDNSITIQVYCWVLAIGYGRLSVNVLNLKS